MSKKLGWSTNDEILYLKNIGRSHLTTRNDRKKCLEGYIKAHKKRIITKGLDMSLILKEAEIQLNRI